MIYHTLHLLVGVSTYCILSTLFTSFRRPLEQFLAEEILTQRGGTGKEARQAFTKRLEKIAKKERAARWSIRYGFPRVAALLIGVYGTLTAALWPLSMLASAVFYAKATTKPETLREICNDL